MTDQDIQRIADATAHRQIELNGEAALCVGAFAALVWLIYWIGTKP